MKKGDAAFVGTMIMTRGSGRGGFQDVAMTFLVEWVVKGPIGRKVDVFTGRGGGDCGLGDQISAGERVGLVLSNRDGRWVAYIGDLHEATALLAASENERYLGSTSLVHQGRALLAEIRPGDPEAIVLVVILIMVGVAITYRLRRDRKAERAASRI